MIPEKFTGVVLFSAPWCGPCKTYKPALTAEAATKGLPLILVDVDQDRALAGQQGIRAVPTTILFRDGVEVRRVSGAQTGAAMKAFMS